MEKHSFAIESFNNIQGLIKFIDQKSGAVLVVSGLILKIFLEFSTKLVFVSFSSLSFTGTITFIFGTATVGLLTYVIYLLIFKVISPRLAKNYSENEFSLFYFEHLAKMGKEQINQQFENLEKERILKYILDQTFEISRILEEKTIALNDSMRYLFFSIVSLLIFVLTSNLI